MESMVIIEKCIDAVAYGYSHVQAVLRVSDAALADPELQYRSIIEADELDSAAILAMCKCQPAKALQKSWNQLETVHEAYTAAAAHFNLLSPTVSTAMAANNEAYAEQHSKIILVVSICLVSQLAFAKKPPSKELVKQSLDFCEKYDVALPPKLSFLQDKLLKDHGLERQVALQPLDM